MKQKIHPEAAADLREAIQWYDSQRTRLGAELFAVVDAGFAKIASHPQLCPRLETWTEDGDIRRLLVPRFPYAIVFEIVDEEIQVLAVAHTRRRPHYWLGRRSQF